MFVTKKALPRRTFLKGVGVSLGAAAARLDDSRAHAAGPDGGRAAPAPRIRLRAARRHHGQVDAGDRGRRLRVHADPQAARAVPRPPERRERPRPSRRRHDRRALAEPDDLAERRAAEGDPGRRRLCRRHRRPDRRAADRPGHGAAVDGAGYRGSLGADRLVRSRLRLHLHEHAVVAHADDADADGDQSAQGVRADVRPGRQRDGTRSRASRRTAASSTRSPRTPPACSCNSVHRTAR